MLLHATGEGNSAYVVAFSPDNRYALTVTRGGGVVKQQAMIWSLNHLHPN